MTTKYRLMSLLAENCALEAHSKMQELCVLQLKTHCLSTLFHQKTKKQKNTKRNKKTRPKKNNRKKKCFFPSLGSTRANLTKIT